MTQFYKRLTTLLVIQSLLLGNTVFSQSLTSGSPSPQNSEDNETVVGQARINHFLNEIIQSQSENSRAPKLSVSEANLLSLQDQYILSPSSNGQTAALNLSLNAMDLPTPFISNPLSDLRFSIKNGNVILQHVKTGLVHEIRNLDPASLDFDGQFLFVLGRDGTLSALSMSLIKALAFQSPIPVSTVAQADVENGVSPTRVRVVQQKDDLPHFSPEILESLKRGEGQRPVLNKGDVVISDSSGHAVSGLRAENRSRKA